LGYSANGGGLPASGGFEEAEEVKEVKEMADVEAMEEGICHRVTEAQRDAKHGIVDGQMHTLRVRYFTRGCRREARALRQRHADPEGGG
jgi:hypothetical protein